MKPEEIESFRKRLASRKSELEVQLRDDEASSGVVELDQSRLGRLSRIDALQAQQMAKEAGRRHRLEMARVSAALARLEAGEFGVCVACGEDIDPRRLDIDPAAARCIDCAQ